MFKKENRFIKKFDFILLFTTIILAIYGIFILKSATMSLRAGSYPYIKTQAAAFILGLCAVIVLLFIDYEIYGYFYIPIYIISNLLLVAVLIWGHGADEWGASNWLSIGGFSFQPSEFAKFGIIISLAKYIDKNKDKINQLFTLSKILIFALIPVAFILKQPDAGTAMVFLFFILIMLFAAGLSYKYIVPVLVIAVIALIIGHFFILGELEKVHAEGLKGDYKLSRILTFYDRTLDTNGKGLQVIQSEIAIGSGQMFGRGYQQGIQNQYGYLPAKETDFIFSILCEEMGFVGGVSLILLYAVLLLRMIKISKGTADMFGSLIVIGIMGMFLFHILENIGMTMRLLPVTGIPLPFVSNGGTFMLINMVSIGLVLSIGLKRGRKDLFN
jgi:rod shape determining protein RodA